MNIQDGFLPACICANNAGAAVRAFDFRSNSTSRKFPPFLRMVRSSGSVYPVKHLICDESCVAFMACFDSLIDWFAFLIDWREWRRSSMVFEFIFEGGFSS